MIHNDAYTIADTVVDAHMLLFYLIDIATNKIHMWRKKTIYWYRNAADATIIPSSVEAATAAATTQTTPTVTFTPCVTPTVASLIMNNADVHAVATGVDQVVNNGRKGRVRKPSGTPRTAGGGVKKKKPVKPPRNPFHRSETGKLQLKRLSMSKSVETMTPRIDVLRARLKTMQERLEFVSGKLKLVVEELTSRTGVGQAVDDGDEGVGTDEAMEDVVDGCSGTETLNVSVGVADEDVELDDEAEVGADSADEEN